LESVDQGRFVVQHCFAESHPCAAFCHDFAEAGVGKGKGIANQTILVNEQ